MAFGEALLLAILAALIAPYVAVAVVQALGLFGPLADAGIATTAAVDDDARIVARWPPRHAWSPWTIDGALGRQPQGCPSSDLAPGRADAAAALGVDLVLVVLAVVGLWRSACTGRRSPRTLVAARLDLAADRRA